MTAPTTLEITEDAAGCVEITFSRPEVLNRFDDIQRDELIAAFQDYGHRDSTRAVILAAKGKVFSAGGDVAMMRERHGDRRATERGVAASRLLVETMLDLPAPVVAAVHGHAYGLGSTIVLGCDAVVSAPGVQIVDSHVKVGLVAGDGGALFWPASAGMIRTKRHLLTGDPVLAEDGFHMGLVSDLVDTPDEVLPHARQLAARIAALPPLAVRGTKRSLNHIMRRRCAEVLELSLSYEAESMHSNDLLEALDAFEQKRPGIYKGE